MLLARHDRSDDAGVRRGPGEVVESDRRPGSAPADLDGRRARGRRSVRLRPAGATRPVPADRLTPPQSARRCWHPAPREAWHLGLLLPRSRCARLPRRTARFRNLIVRRPGSSRRPVGSEPKSLRSGFVLSAGEALRGTRLPCRRFPRALIDAPPRLGCTRRSARGLLRPRTGSCSPAIQSGRRSTDAFRRPSALLLQEGLACDQRVLRRLGPPSMTRSSHSTM